MTWYILEIILCVNLKELTDTVGAYMVIGCK